MKNKIRKNHICIMLMSSFLLTLTGCITPLSGNRYDRGTVGVQAEAYPGLLLAVERVIVEGSRSGLGSVAGAAIGSQLGSDYRGGVDEAQIASILGGILGGVAGAAVEEGLTSSPGFRYTVRLEDGRVIAVVQQDKNPVAQPGQPVQLLYGNQVRVVPAYQGLVYHP